MAKDLFFLAVPVEIWEVEFQRIGISNALSDYEVKLMIYDPVQKNILSWQV